MGFTISPNFLKGDWYEVEILLKLLRVLIFDYVEH